MRNITNVQHHVGIKVQKGGKQEKRKTQKQHTACREVTRYGQNCGPIDFEYILQKCS